MNTVKSFFEKIIRSIVINNVSIADFEQRKQEILIDRLSGMKNVEIDFSFWYKEPFNVFENGDFKLLKIGKDVSFRKWCNFLIYKNATLIIEENVFFNNYCSINCLEKIEIGENTLFGEGVKVYDHNHKHSFSSNRLMVERNDFTTSPVKIGKNCWIGSNVTILKGVEIGDNVIVGANCLVYKSIPSNTIVKHSEVLILEQR